MSQPQIPGFTVRGPLGRGAIGSVWCAARDHDDRLFAIKVMPVRGDAAQEAADQAVRELGVLSRIEHAHVVRMHAAIPLDDGRVALVLDHVDGGSLSAVVAARGHLRPGEVVTTLAPLAKALADLHQLGVVHADLSPGNVLFTSAGKPMLSDFGVARLIGERPEMVHATAGFVAPEVADGAIPSPESDVYGLGALAWHCLVGAPPAAASTRPALDSLVPGLPVALVSLVTGCLRSDPAARPSAGALAVGLFDAAPAEPVLLADGPDPAAQITHRIRAGAVESAPPSPSRRQGRRPARRLPRFSVPSRALPRLQVPRVRMSAAACTVVTGVLVVAALLGAATGWWLSRPDDAAGAASSTAGAPVAAVPRSSSASPAASLSRSREAARSNPRGLVQEMADARASALTARDRARLKAVYTPASASLRKDEQTIANAVSAKATYVGLRLLVRDAAWVSGSGQQATVRARIDTSAYQMRYVDGRATSAAPAPADPVVMILSWTGAGWRISSVRAG